LSASSLIKPSVSASSFAASLAYIPNNDGLRGEMHSFCGGEKAGNLPLDSEGVVAGEAPLGGVAGYDEEEEEEEELQLGVAAWWCFRAGMGIDWDMVAFRQGEG